MSKKFNIKPPTWPKEYTFAEFAKLNSHIINENQLVSLYNQYLNKYLMELGEKKIHFKQSKINQLLTELKNSQLDSTISIATPGGGGERNYSLQFGGAAKENYVTTTFDPDTYNLRLGYTISYWIKPNTITSVNQIAIGARGDSTRRFVFGVKNATNMLFGGGSNQSENKAHGMSVGNWYHWVITYSGNEGGGSEQYVRAYRNGEAVVIANDDTTGGAYAHHSRAWTEAGTEANSVPVLYFGARNGQGTPDKWFDCNLTDIAIFNEMKDTAVGDYNAVNSDVAGPVPGFVTYAYNGGKLKNLKNESGLVGYWRFNNNTLDSSGNGNHGTLAVTGNQGTDLPFFTNDIPK